MSSDAPVPRAPAWLNEALIEKALMQRPSAVSQRVLAFTISRATAPGDHYASTIYRIKATTASCEDHTLLVKILPEGGTLARAIIKSGLFDYETAMLAKHIPSMQALLEEASPGGFPPFAARCLLHAALPAPFLVLEDMAPQGFRLAERRRGLGLRHCLLALRSLARFHAASAALLRAHPTVANEIPNFFRKETETWEPFVSSAIQMTADACRRWAGFEQYAQALDRFKPNAMTLFAEVNDPTVDGFNVIIHGDFWSNNIMFKYDKSGHPEALRMVDFQLSHVASPAIDLLYFLNSSVSDDVSQHHEKLLLREYHVALVETLRLLHLPGPSFEDLQRAIDTHSVYALFGALGVWPIARASVAPDINASLDGDPSSSAQLYDNPSTTEWLQRKLPQFKRRGWLNF